MHTRVMLIADEVPTLILYYIYMRYRLFNLDVGYIKKYKKFIEKIN